MMIRFATEKDLPTCKKFDEMSVAALRSAVRAKQVILAFDGGEATGYLRLEYLWSRVPYIGRIVVKEDSRGRGIGKRVLQFLEAHLRRRGFKLLLSSSEADQPRPQYWHRKMGFEECGAIAGINERDVDEVFFRKRLR